MNVTDDSPRTETAENGPAPIMPRRRQWGRRLVGIVVVLAALVAVAPTVLARTELRQHVLPWLFPNYAGTFHVGQASWGWLQPVEMREVTVFDLEGEPLLTIPDFRSELPLLTIGTDIRRSLRFVLDRPVLLVRMRHSGSNLEDALESLSSGPPSSSRLPWNCRIADGVLRVQHAPLEPAMEMAGLHGTLERNDDPSAKCQIDLKGDVDAGGSALVRAHWPTVNAPASGVADISGEVELNGFASEQLEPLLRRWFRRSPVAGVVTLNATVSPAEPQSNPRWEIRGQAHSEEFTLRSLNEDSSSDVIVRQLSLALNGSVPPDRSRPAVTTAVGTVTAEWAAAELLGTELGAGQTHAELAGGVLQFEQLDVAFGNGRMRARPRILLNEQPPLLVLEESDGPQRVLDRVRLSPALCREWLRYIAPVMADAADMDGQFSLEVGSARIPIHAPEEGRIQGDFLIEGARMGPGPMARQILGLVGQVRSLVQGRSAAGGLNTWMQMPPQTVRFRVADGRVEHSWVSFQAGSTLIRTQGTVGFDHSLQLVAQVPLNEAWVRSVPALRGQVVEVPIRGTLERPEIDQRVWSDSIRKLGEGAAGGLLNDVLRDQLQRLLPRRQ